MANPNINSKYYITTAYGGWSPCIQGNNAYGLRPFNGSVLPNCVGYTVGRFNERLGLNACTWLGSVNANQMLNLAISQGLPHGNDPVVGGVICWDSSGAGHCAVVEQIVSSTEIVTTESGWNYSTTPIWRTRTRYKVNGVWTYTSGYTFQGFFYPPSSPPSPSTDDDYYMLFLSTEALWK